MGCCVTTNKEPARKTIMLKKPSMTRENGELLDLEVPVETWLAGKTEAVLTVPSGSPVVRVEIDPEALFPDIDRDNNVWDALQDAGAANDTGTQDRAGSER